MASHTSVGHARVVRSLIGILLAVSLTACASASGDSGTDAASPSPSTAGGLPAAAPAAPSPTPRAVATPTPDPAAPGEKPETAVPGKPMPDIVRGAYVHPFSFWDDRWAGLVQLVKDTELNALVVDVKDESGTLLFDVDNPIAKADGGADWRDDYSGLEDRLKMLHDAGGWAIARIACFKDTRAADARPDLAVQNASGGVWKAHKNFSWLNPYQDGAGQYCIDVALAALKKGFDEIQFDYIRFPNGGDGDTSNIRLPGVPEGRPRSEWRHSDEIVGFLKRAAEQIHKAGGYISADLFGLVTYDFRWDAGGTGQVLERIAQYVDVISLMVYPSHYNKGNYGLYPHPIEHPYETVWNAMQEAQMRVQGLHARIRPWLEDFAAPWMGYPTITAQHVLDQKKAVYDNGIDSWLLWNAANKYTVDALEKGKAVSHMNTDFRPPARTANPDAPPGEVEKKWPGMPSCDPYPGRLLIGEGNLAGSTPPNLALPYDDPRLCAGVPDGTEAHYTWQERAAGAVEPGATPAPAPAPSPTG